MRKGKGKTVTNKGKEWTAKEIQRLIGCSLQNAYRYFKKIEAEQIDMDWFTGRVRLFKKGEIKMRELFSRGRSGFIFIGITGKKYTPEMIMIKTGITRGGALKRIKKAIEDPRYEKKLLLKELDNKKMDNTRCAEFGAKELTAEQVDLLCEFNMVYLGQRSVNTL